MSSLRELFIAMNKEIEDVIYYSDGELKREHIIVGLIEFVKTNWINRINANRFTFYNSPNKKNVIIRLRDV